MEAARAHASLLSEMLASVQDGATASEDGALLLYELAHSCNNMQIRLVNLIQEAETSKIGTLLELHDQLADLLKKVDTVRDSMGAADEDGKGANEASDDAAAPDSLPAPPAVEGDSRNLPWENNVVLADVSARSIGRRRSSSEPQSIRTAVPLAGSSSSPTRPTRANRSMNTESARRLLYILRAGDDRAQQNACKAIQHMGQDPILNSEFLSLGAIRTLVFLFNSVKAKTDSVLKGCRRERHCGARVLSPLHRAE